MAFSAGSVAIFNLDNSSGSLTQISSYLSSAKLHIERADTDLPVLGAGAVSRLVGPPKGTISLEGWGDPTIEEIFESGILLATATTRTYEYGPAGSSTSQRKYTGEAYIMDFEIDTAAEDPGSFTAELVTDSTITQSTW